MPVMSKAMVFAAETARGLTKLPMCVTVRHMKTISIRELHSRTGQLVREASRYGEIHVTDNGRVVARIVPQTAPADVPYFARRKPSEAFNRLEKSGKTAQGMDSTVAISQDREARV